MSQPTRSTEDVLYAILAGRFVGVHPTWTWSQFFFVAALEILRGSGPGSDHLRMSDRKAPPPVPPAFARQRAMAAQRVSESVRPDDSASVASSTWSVVREESNFPPPSPHPCSSPSVFPPAQPMVPKAPPKGFEKNAPATLDPWAEAAEESDDLAEIPHDARVGASSSAFPAPSHGLNPATEAAKTALGKKEKQLLDQQKARAKQKNRRGLRWGQFHQVGITQNFELPWFIRQLGSKTDERSILILDSRDARIQSPFQGWLLDEILLNSHSEVNVLADRQSIRTPISGYHMNPLLHEDDRRVQGDHCGKYDFIHHSAMCSLGHSDWGCSIPWGLPTVQVAHHAWRQSYLGRRQDQGGRVFAAPLRDAWISLGPGHVCSTELPEWFSDHEHAGAALCSICHDHSLSGMESDRHDVRGGGQTVCMQRWWRGSSARLPALPLWVQDDCN